MASKVLTRCAELSPAMEGDCAACNCLHTLLLTFPARTCFTNLPIGARAESVALMKHAQPSLRKGRIRPSGRSCTSPFLKMCSVCESSSLNADSILQWKFMCVRSASRCSWHVHACCLWELAKVLSGNFLEWLIAKDKELTEPQNATSSNIDCYSTCIPCDMLCASTCERCLPLTILEFWRNKTIQSQPSSPPNSRATMRETAQLVFVDMRISLRSQLDQANEMMSALQ